MKVLIIIGNPHKKGTSVLLVDEFIKGFSFNNNNDETISETFEVVCLDTIFKNSTNYLAWKNIGGIVATTSNTIENILKTDFPTQIYEFGSNMK